MDISPQRITDMANRYRSSHRAWHLTLAAVFVAEAIMMLRVGRHQWYFFDEWRLVVERVIPTAHGPNGLFKQLFVPDGEHVIAIPLGVFIVLTRLFGIDNYWPFIIANVLVRIGTLWLADDILRRLRTRRVARLLVVASLAFFGQGFESLFGQSIIFAGFTLVFCLLAIREMLKPHASQWRAGIITAAYLVGAIFSSSYGFPVVVGVSLYLLFTSRRIAAALALIVPPVAFLLVRALAGGSYAQQQPVAFGRLPLYVEYVQFGLAKLGEGITGLVGLGLASYVLLVVLCLWFGRGRQQAWFAISIIVSVVAFFGQASVSRSVFGAEQAGASRYLFFCGALTFVMLGVSWGQRQLDHRASIVAAALIVLSLAHSAGSLVTGSSYYTTKMELSRGRLAVGFVAAQRGVPLLVPDPDWAPDLYRDRLQAVLDWSGSDEFIAAGTVCFEHRLDELTAAGIDARSLSQRDQAALVLLLNEHAQGFGENALTIGGLITMGADGSSGSKVIDQFKDDYAMFTTELTMPSALPSLARCG